MSGRLVSAVLESKLPAWLKPYAIAFASFAADDGSKVFPGQKRIARLVSRSERMTRYATTELRRLGVLEIVEPSTYCTTPRYRFRAERLPDGGDGKQIDLFTNVSQFPQRNHFDFGVKERFPQISTALTGNGLPLRGATDCPRSVSRSVNYSKYTRARAKPEKAAI